MTASPAQRRRTIATLALPIVAGMVSQNITNLIDTAMMGFVGPTALAAVGMASFANFMCIAFITGLTAGVAAMAARRKGEGQEAEMAVPLNGGLFWSLVIGLPSTIALIFAAPCIFQFLSDDPAVREIGVPYMQIRLVGMVGIGMNYAYRGYWNGVGRSAVYMRTLIAMHVAQIAIAWVFIFGKFGAPELGAVGAGIGNTSAVFLGTALYTLQAFRLARGNGFFVRLPRPETLMTILRISLPASVQQLFISAGFTALFSIIGRIGTEELAAANVLLNLSQTAFLPGLGLGLTAAALVGQALGRNDPSDARAWGWQVMRIGMLVMTVVGAPMVLFPDPILGIFLRDPAILEIARGPLQVAGATIMVEAVALILLNALQGAGATLLVAKIAIGLQWVMFLPLAYLIGPVWGLGLLGVWSWHIGYRFIAALVFVSVWRSDVWQKMKV